MNISLRNMPIGLKVSLAPAVAIAGLVLVALIGFLSSRSLSNEMNQVGVDGVARLMQMESLNSDISELNELLYKSLTWESTGQRDTMIKKLDDQLLSDLKKTQTMLDAAAADKSDSRADDFKALDAVYTSYSKSVADTLDMKSTGVANAATFVAVLEDQYTKMHEILKKMTDQELARSHDAVATAQASVVHRGWMSAGVAVLALVLVSVLSLVFKRAIVEPLERASELAAALSQGNLTLHHSDRSTDATGQVLSALDGVAHNLSGMVSDIRSTAQDIDTALSEIANANSDLSTRTESAASSLQEASASVEQLTTMVRQSAENANVANSLAKDASGVARQGGQMVKDVVTTMDKINSQAKKIGEIIATIDGIAFQTNILALNAAVEAARAGDQGRGFAVVAGEVRNLAGRSAEAAREIRTLIGSSVEQIEIGVDKVQATGVTMDKIVGAIERVSSTVDEIARSASEQATGISQVNQTVSQMEQSTQQNAAMVEEASAATDSLRQQSQRLVQLLSRFRTA